VPFTARVFRILESELNRNLSLSYSILGNLSRPESQKIRVLDRFRLKVWVRNNGSLSMKNVRGVIRATELASFASTPFTILDLGPHEECAVAEIDARILRAARNGSIFEQIVTVNVIGQADLTDFWFRDSRAVTYVKSAPGTRQPSDGGQWNSAGSPGTIAPLPANGTAQDS